LWRILYLLTKFLPDRHNSTCQVLFYAELKIFIHQKKTCSNNT